MMMRLVGVNRFFLSATHNSDRWALDGGGELLDLGDLGEFLRFQV